MKKLLIWGLLFWGLDSVAMNPDCKAAASGTVVKPENLSLRCQHLSGELTVRYRRRRPSHVELSPVSEHSSDADSSSYSYSSSELLASPSAPTQEQISADRVIGAGLVSPVELRGDSFRRPMTSIVPDNVCNARSVLHLSNENEGLREKQIFLKMVVTALTAYGVAVTAWALRDTAGSDC